MTSKVIYKGGLRATATHLRSSSIVETDAPVDNHGKGERFSPTDLVATALTSCMVTTMGIAANAHSIDIDGTECEVEKIMAPNPRRIAEVKVNVYMPKTKTYNDHDKKIMEHAALTCPVVESLHPDCKKTILFVWR